MTNWAWTTQGLRIRSNLLLAFAFFTILAGLAAGLAAQGWPGFLAVALACCIARLMERPWLVTRIGVPGSVEALFQALVVQVAVVFVLYLLGFGLSAITGWRPALPLWLPAGVVLTSALLSRLIWRPMPPEWDGFLDEATETLNRMAAETEAMNRPEGGSQMGPEYRADTAQTPDRDAGGRQG